ncbi:sigma-70 family RNA polymerase sigma factor [Streptomyces sp. 3MP-14]|uniref:Sigma-70 family RNA polymerase sigma factor n=1 Tax=Streptomyces mimosae TaxID=2586635 RepID=A0A5N6ASE3_9ACTN|nr:MULTISPECIES: RNA polymerase sigma factor [Streptomyces]KAB8171032.1 sigma-70 family RNA polymerase sigma factor [Streptomyces mimosae]KAB8179617.1 sigma-70 family RNA polymerase sigma factor [Streptomyces sp. 3MP-14]
MRKVHRAEDRNEEFDRLFRATFRRLLAYCLRRTSEASAHDAVSEVYATAWRRRGRVPHDPHEAQLWLFGVARRVLANQERGQRRWLRLQRRVAEAPAPPALAPSDDLAEALAALPPDDRELLRLAYWDDLSHQDIATVLGISTGAVATRLYRARERLRPHLAAGADPPPPTAARPNVHGTRTTDHRTAPGTAPRTEEKLHARR